MANRTGIPPPMQSSVEQWVLLGYATGLVCVTALVILLHSGRGLVARLRQLWKSWMAYPLLISRPRGTTSFSRANLMALIVLVAANTVACTLLVREVGIASRRCALLAMINLLPLMLGGRTNLLLDRILRVERDQAETWHRWIGRIFLIEGFVHGLTARATASSADPDTYVRMVWLFLLPLTLLMSLHAIRRAAYEVFLCTHVLFYVVGYILLWIHVGPGRTLPTYLLIVAAVLYGTQSVLWAVLFVANNFWQGRARVFGVSEHRSDEASAVRLQLDVRTRVKFCAGQYAYVTLSGGLRQCHRYLQAHPLYIIRVEERQNQEARVQRLDFLITPRRGFSRQVRRVATGSSAWINGPYGSSAGSVASDCDVFVLFAESIGVVAHLGLMHDLLRRPPPKPQRISLHWQLHHDGEDPRHPLQSATAY